MPIIRCQSTGFDYLSLLRIQYWDNSALFMKSGYPVGIIIPTETYINWFISPLEDDQIVLDLASSSEHQKEWCALTIPNPFH